MEKVSLHKYTFKDNNHDFNSLMNEKCRLCTGFEEKLDEHCEANFNSEIAELEKHDLISELVNFLGSDPSEFSKAEDIFEKLKYQITEFVVKNEFNRNHKLSVELTMWLESKKEPKALNLLHNVMHEYLT